MYGVNCRKRTYNKLVSCIWCFVNVACVLLPPNYAPPILQAAWFYLFIFVFWQILSLKQMLGNSVSLCLSEIKEIIHDLGKKLIHFLTVRWQVWCPSHNWLVTMKLQSAGGLFILAQQKHCKKGEITSLPLSKVTVAKFTYQDLCSSQLTVCTVRNHNSLFYSWLCAGLFLGSFESAQNLEAIQHRNIWKF